MKFHKFQFKVKGDELLSQFLGRVGGSIPNNNNFAEAAADINQ